MSGEGAKKEGGRWNSINNALVYSSTSRALACRKTIVHLNAAALPLNRFLVQIEIPDLAWGVRTVLDMHTAPVGWGALPVERASIKYGNSWIRSRSLAVLLVPSVTAPEEQNILINPAHADDVHIKDTKIRKWLYDSRLA